MLTAVGILVQRDTLGASVTHIVMASGTSTAGLALAGKALGASYRVHAVSVGGSREMIEAQMLGFANSAADFTVHDAYVGERYGGVFVHSGGPPITFACGEEIREHLGGTAHPD